MDIVTGASGHIGNVLVRELLARGKTVPPPVLPNDDYRLLKGLDIELVQGNVTDLSSLEAAFTGAEFVYHLAGIVPLCPAFGGYLKR